MNDIVRPPKVFISAVTSELGGIRELLRDILDQHGADVDAQSHHPNSLADGLAIQRAIDECDLAVCLIGWRYGRELPAGNRPPEARPDDSWTQWEYRYARKHARAVRLFCYHGPNDASAEPEPLADRQKTFREEVERTEEGTFGGLFYSTFRDGNEIKSAVEGFIRSRQGALAMFQAGTWAKVRAQYRAATVNKWRKDFPDADNSNANGTEGTRGFPFIATQGFSILAPVAGQQQRYLTPEAFLPGRETEIEASARRGSTWSTVTRAQVRDALLAAQEQPNLLGDVDIPRRRRLFLVGGGGMGKSTNMRWLEAALNGLDDERDEERTAPVDALALLVNFGDPNESLVDKSDEQVGNVLRHVIAKRLGLPEDNRSTKSRWFMEAIADGLRRDAARERLAILIDGLDHVGADKVPLLTSIQSDAPGRYWTPCTVVASGRPQAVQRWQDTPANMDSTVATSHWRFIEPVKFNEAEAKFFLDTREEEGRYQLVADKLGGLTNVPRVLEYIRALSLDQLRDVRTPADIYGKAIKELTLRTLAAGGKQGRLIGTHRESDWATGEPSYDQANYVIELLSIFAFLSMCPTTDPDHWIPPSFDNLVITDDHRVQVWSRLEPNHSISGDESRDLKRDLRALAAFSTIVHNGVLDAVGTVSETMECMVWSNRTIQEFLAAYWLAKHAKGAEALAARLAGKPLDIDPWDPRRDCERVRHHLFHPEDKETDLAYELNQFLAEMPASDRTPSSWVAAASAWYDPNPREQAEPAASGRKWSTEMLYRSWPTMLDIAGLPLDDWWDLPYEGIVQCLPGTARAKASPHQRRTTSHSAPAADLARKVLNRFRSDFQAILDSPRDSASRRLAHELIADENWIAVPAGCYEMGAPLDRQGFPGKVKANWMKELDDVQTGEVTAKDAAKRSTKAEWFTGAQGERLREADIGWLAGTFSQVEPRNCVSAPSVPDHNAKGYVAALTALRDQWSRPDETPAENPQAIAAFTMHRFPILREWYYLFAPGQRHAVQSYLGSVAPPGDDHPAIYISWFDAWAFCQWATWVVADETGANGQRRYGLRLPHEPEWEYAARWHRDQAGAATQTPPGQRYWWGDAFYESPDAPNPEPLTKPEAHAVGHPGGTRPPREASPNGLGFHDILGNVWEWTANVYAAKYTRAFPQNGGRSALRHVPVNPERTMRGGLWYYLDVLANCSARFRLACNDRDYKMGFRVVREERPLK
jgi:formylglycine-generating enzyme required for sulfatase activity